MKDDSSIGVVRVGLSIVILGALLVGPAFGKALEADSRWTGKQIQVDGRSDDWPSVQGTYLSEQGTAFTFANDGQFLYILFRTNDQRWPLAIKRTGLTLYFDTGGGKKKDASICFKGGPTAEEVMALRSRGSASAENRPRRGGQRMLDMDEVTTPSLTCSSKSRLKDESIPLDGTAGPGAAFDTCQGYFTYEFRVPLVAGKEYAFGIGAEPGKSISVGAVWGDMGGMMQPGGGPEGDMDVPPGGGIGGPGSGLGMPPGDAAGGLAEVMGRERPRMPGKQDVWFKTTIASPNTPAPTESK